MHESTERKKDKNHRDGSQQVDCAPPKMGAHYSGNDPSKKNTCYYSARKHPGHMTDTLRRNMQARIRRQYVGGYAKQTNKKARKTETANEVTREQQSEC